jgi:hypothetical protein
VIGSTEVESKPRPALLPPVQARPPQAPPDEATQQKIRELAYQVYENRGRVDGYDVRDWLEAEATLRAQGKIAA